MQVFVSYSFDESADKLTNVIAALHAHRIRFWHHSRAIAGRPLVQELRRGIAQSSACVYVATKKSLQSDWCKAEVERSGRRYTGHFLLTGRRGLDRRSASSTPRRCSCFGNKCRHRSTQRSFWA